MMPERPDVEGMEARCAKATEGPWPMWYQPMTGGAPGNRDRGAYIRIGYHDICLQIQNQYLPVKVEPSNEPGYCIVSTDGVWPPWPDADDGIFIAHARTDMPALIAWVKRLEEALKRYGVHPPTCDLVNLRRGNKCTCGLATLTQPTERTKP